MREYFTDGNFVIGSKPRAVYYQGKKIGDEHFSDWKVATRLDKLLDSPI
jgi:hypothetical protein